MVTSIQISENLRDKLQKYKKTSKTSYEDVIEKLVKNYETSNEKEIQMLKEGYLEMKDDSKKINKEWESIDEPW